MSLKTVYAAILLLSGLITLGIGLFMLFDSPGFAAANGIRWQGEAGVHKVVTGLGSTVASLGLLQLIAAWRVHRGAAFGVDLGLALGSILLLVGAVSYVRAGATEILLLDGVRGGLILIVGYLVRRGPE